MVMISISKEAREYLLKKGHVYTFRTKRRKEGKDWAADGRGRPKICNVQVEFVKEVNGVNDLTEFVDGSGFSHLWHWVAEIKRLNPKINSIKGYLYLVRRKKEDAIFTPPSEAEARVNRILQKSDVNG
jgi:hypothetical protein